MISYTWFVERVIKSFRNNQSFTDFNYKSVFKECMGEKLNGVSNKEIEHLDEFKMKIGVMITHIDKLVTASFDAVRVDEKFKEDEEKIYFAQITARYNLYNVMREIEGGNSNKHEQNKLSTILC